MSMHLWTSLSCHSSPPSMHLTHFSAATTPHRHPPYSSLSYHYSSPQSTLLISQLPLVLTTIHFTHLSAATTLHRHPPYSSLSWHYSSPPSTLLISQLALLLTATHLTHLSASPSPLRHPCTLLISKLALLQLHAMKIWPTVNLTMSLTCR